MSSRQAVMTPAAAPDVRAIEADPVDEQSVSSSFIVVQGNRRYQRSLCLLPLSEGIQVSIIAANDQQTVGSGRGSVTRTTKLIVP